MSENEKLAAAMRTRLNFALVKVQKGWEDRSLDQLEMEKQKREEKEKEKEKKKHVRSEVSAKAIRPSPESGIRSADSSPRMPGGSFNLSSISSHSRHTLNINTILLFSIPLSLFSILLSIFLLLLNLIINSILQNMA